MSMNQIIETVRGFDGALVLQPGPGSDFPELAWGDAFFYYAPGGQVPTAVQPYGTIITKNYPDDTTCDLDEPDRGRVNLHVGRGRAGELVGACAPDTTSGDGVPPSGRVPSDTFLAHPVYGDTGWVCVVDPCERTSGAVLTLLREAHDSARRRYDRRRSVG
jgi:hypothetical protein